MTDPARRHSRRSGAPSPLPSPLWPVVYLFILSIYLFISVPFFKAAPAGPAPRRRCRPLPAAPRPGLRLWPAGVRRAAPGSRCDGAVTPLPAPPALPLLVFTSPCSGITQLRLRMARWMWRAWLGLGVAVLARFRVLPEDLKSN